MATINDYKLLEFKCINLFDALNKDSFTVDYYKNLNDKGKARFGFYYFVIQMVTNYMELDDITDCICDTDFHAKTDGDPQDDFGIDAICFNDEDNEIHIFNFKYREDFVEDMQKRNEVWLSSKFFSYLVPGSTETLTPRMKELADQILQRYNSKNIWKTFFYVVTNTNKTIPPEDSVLQQMKANYDLQIHTIGLPEITPYLSYSHKEIDASMVFRRDAIMTFTEDDLSSNKSYIVRMALPDLIRITCGNENLRKEYNLEDYGQLTDVDVDLDVLFDNVRGFILNSKFNVNIENTLEHEASKFFFYNNGLTIVAENIISSSQNGGRLTKLDIKNYQVLNGGQTLRTIHEYNKKSGNNLVDKMINAEVLVRLLNITDDNIKNCIAEYTNSQNAIDLMDLKSLRKEQLLLEAFLKDNGIVYLRKKGQTVSIEAGEVQIGIQRMGQILLATKGKRPEEASNKKKLIFSDYYDELFTNNQELISNQTVIDINNYLSLRSEYRKQNISYSIQKALYVLFVLTLRPEMQIADAIIALENNIESYKSDNNLELDYSRVLIKQNFRAYLEQNVNSAQN
jgi:hypothetical protein